MHKKLVMLTLGLLSLMGCTSAPSKTPAQHKAVMFRADAQNTGVYQTEGVKEKPRLSWRYPTWDVVPSEVVVFNNTVFLSEKRSGIVAIDTQTGKLKWDFKVYNIPFTGVRTSVAVVDGVLYFGALDLYFYAVEAETGQELWRYEVDRILSSPTVSSGIIYFEEAGGTLIALDAKTGQLLWHQAVELHKDSAPAVAEGKVVITQPDGFVKAFDGITGSPLWESQVGELGEVVPVMANGYVYVASLDQHLYAIDTETGNIRWQFNAEGKLYFSPALSEGVVYVSSFLGKLHAIDAKTGEKLWRFTNEEVILTLPVIADGYLYIVGADSNALSSGSGSDQFDSYIYAFSLATGEVKWQLTTQLPINHLMTISEGALYLGGKGALFKFE